MVCILKVDDYIQNYGEDVPGSQEGLPAHRILACETAE